MARNKTSTLSVDRADTAAERLQRVSAEIAELERPLPTTHGVDTDLDALTDHLVERGHRREALKMIVPALERAALEERRPDILARRTIETEAWNRAAALAGEVRIRLDGLQAEWSLVSERNDQAMWRVQEVNRELQGLDVAIRLHDDRHNPTAPVAVVAEPPWSYNSAPVDKDGNPLPDVPHADGHVTMTAVFGPN